MLNNFNFQEAFELRGHWQQPSARAQVSGVLSYSPEKGISLTLFGSFRPGDFPARGLQHFEVLIGNTLESEPCTLAYCQEVYWSGPNPHGVSHSTFRPQFVLIGKHYHSIEEIVSSELHIELRGLEEWLGGRPVELIENDEVPGQWKVEYHSPRSVTARSNTLKATLIAEERIGISYEESTAVVPRGGFAVIRFDSPQNLEPCLDLVFAVQTLFAIVTGKILPVRSVLLSAPGDRHRSYLFFHFAQIDTSEQRFMGFLLKRYNLGGRSEAIELNMQLIVENWFAKRERLRTASDLLMASFSHRDVTEIEFGLLAQGVEAFHRNNIGGTFMSKKAFASVRRNLEESIPETLSADHRYRIKELLRYGYELSLRKRLQDLADRLPSRIARTLCLDDAKIQAFVKTRNRLAHREIPSARIHQAELSRQCRELFMILQILILQELGVPDDMIERGVLNNPGYGRFLDYSRLNE